MRTGFLAIAAWLLATFATYAQVSSPELDAQLLRYETRVKDKAAADTRQSIALFRQAQQAMAEGRTAAAIDALETLAGRTGGRAQGGAQTWLRLAAAWDAQGRSTAKPADPSANPEDAIPAAPEEAMTAAYGAYRRAASNEERIESLALMGNLLLRNMRAARKAEQAAVKASQDQDAKIPIYNTDSLRRLARVVFTELGKLASSGKYQNQIRDLTPPAFTLKRIAYPPSSMTPDDNGSRCRVPLRGRNDQGQQQPEDDGAVPLQCDENLTNLVCLDFSRPINARPEDLRGKISVRRMDRGANEPPIDLPASVQRQPTDASRDESGASAADVAASKADTGGSRVCYANLAFGARYRFTIDKTLKSADDAAFEGPFSKILTMPDLAPALGFKHGTYILPAKGLQTFSMVTTNVRAASLRIRRIGDRNLFRELVTRHIVRGLDYEGSCFIMNDIGEKIADGAVKINAVPNKEVSVELPIGQILDKRREWLPGSGASARNSLPPFSTASSALSVDLFGDSAASAASNDRAGVFVVFGKIEGETTADSGGSDNPDCPSGFASQWFAITNVGLTLQRSNSRIYVIARELDTGAPIEGATLEFISRSGLRLETVKTAENGMAEIDARLGRGTGGNALVAVLAYRDQDYAFLDMTAGAIDLSDRGFDGRAKTSEVDAFVAPARDIYRPGEKIKALVWLRAPDGSAIVNPPPFEVALVKPAVAATPAKGQGRSVQPKKPADNARVVQKQVFNPATPGADFNQGGGFFVDMPIPVTTPEGMLKLEVRLADQIVGSTDIDVRYFRPYTVQINPKLETWSGALSPAGVLQLKGTPTADYLYGKSDPGNTSATDAPAANLRSEAEITVEPALSPLPACFEGFSFGRNRNDALSQIVPGAALPTDKAGRIELDLTREGLSGQSEVPLQASIKLALLDLNGKAAQTAFQVPLVQAGRHWIGIKAGEVTRTRDGQSVKFQYVVLDENNRPIQPRLSFSVYKEQMSFEWSKDGASWNFTRGAHPVRSLVMDHVAVPPAGGNPPAVGACPGTSSFSIPFKDDGSYVIALAENSANGAVTELSHVAGSTTARDGSLKPDALRVITQSSLVAGNSLTVTVETPHRAGKVLGELISAGKVIQRFEGDIEADQDGNAGHVSKTLTGTWPVGPMHIYVTSFRKSEGDTAEKGPARAIGGTQVEVGAARKPPVLELQSDWRELAPWQLNQAGTLPIVIAADGLDPDAWVAVAAVDEGVLSVTQFKTPDPHEYYFGPKRLNFDVFDNYGRILYKVGGDSALEAVRGVGYQPNEVVIWHSGIQRMVDGRAIVQMPASQIPPTFQGRIRFMIWAWDGKTLAKLEHQVPVRDPVVVRVLAPRFMAPGDTAQIPLRVSNTSSNPADVAKLDITMRVSGPLALPDTGADAASGGPCFGGAAPQSCRHFIVEARKGEPPTAITIPLSATTPAQADDTAAQGKIQLSYELGGKAIEREWAVPVRLPYPRTTRVFALSDIPPNETKSFGIDAIDRVVQQFFNPASARLAIRLSRHGLLPSTSEGASAETQIRQLDQLASTLQLLLTSQEASANQSAPSQADHDALVARLNTLVVAITALQEPESGSFGDTRSRSADDSAGSDTPRIGKTAFALDVLARARAAGVTVSDDIFNRGIGYLLSSLRYLASQSERNVTCGLDHVYSLVVLAKLNAIGRSSFENVASNCADSSVDPASALMLATAYSAFGLTEEAQRMLADIQVDGLPTLPDDPANAARAAALVLENPIGPTDPIALLQKVGLGANDTMENLATASWFARASAAALTILEKQTPPFKASDVAVSPAALTPRVFRDGLALDTIADQAPPDGAKQKPLTLTNYQNVQLANRSASPLHVNLAVDGVPLNMDDASSNGFAIERRRVGGETAPAELKQYELVYFTVEINQNDQYLADQRLAAVQVLPTGFEGVDVTYQRGWAATTGSAINPEAVSALEYAEFQDDRWIALPAVGSWVTGSQHHLLAFAVRPTIPGEFILPPVVVRDLNNPARIAWSKPQRIKVVPAN